MRRIDDKAFEIRLDTGDAVQADGLTAAFVRRRIEQFKRGELELSPAIDAEGLRQEDAQMEAEILAAAARSAADA